MKGFNRLTALFAVLAVVMIAAVNIVLLNTGTGSGKQHMVEANRIVREISETGSVPDISGFITITGVYVQPEGTLYEGSEDCVMRRVNGVLYRIEYEERSDNGKTVLYVNALLGTFVLAVMILLIYIRRNIIAPFGRINQLPYELAKGTLTEPLTESKSRYFGKFIWGLDMLRENTERMKQSELSLRKEKKTMLMSLSHDIKTPLSAIKLYSAALSKGIYTDPEKQREAAVSIGENADEIERLVLEIMKSGSEDIMDFDVKDSEFYMSGVIEHVAAYYRDRLQGTRFTVHEYTDCILSGDEDRLTEVLRNIMENAIKYGDGHYIDISFSDEEDCRLITVANSGCTLREAELPYIFDSFRRGSNVGSKSGNGLGLYISRRLMNAMNGDIFAEVRDGEMRVTSVCRKK